MRALRREIRVAQRLLVQLQRERDRQAAQGEAADNGGVEAGEAADNSVAQGVGGGVLAGTGVGGEEVPVAIRKYFEDIAILLRNHPTVLPTTMLGLTRIDKNEAIVVRTTMASQQLGISPDAMLREIAYSHSRCFGKGERKVPLQGRGRLPAGQLFGGNLCCLPATLKQGIEDLA
eukprot:Em0882g3a